MAGVDIQLPWNIGLDVAYVGNKVSKLGVTRNVNSVPKSENDKAIPSLGGNTGLSQRDVPEPVRRAGSRAGPQRRDGVARAAAAAVPAVHRHFSMNRLNLRIARTTTRSKRPRPSATRNGVMFAVNYTWMKLEDEVNFFTDYDTDAVPRPPGRSAAASPRHHHARSICRSDRASRSAATPPASSPALIGGWQFNTIGEIQSGRPLGLNGSAIQLDPDVALPKSEQSFERWFDNSSTALNNPRPDGTFAWSVLGTERLPRRQAALPRRQRADRAAVVVLAVQEHADRPRRKSCSSGSRRSTSSTCGSTAGRTPTRASANFGIVDTASQVNFPRTIQLGARLMF